ncbi:Caspase-1 [Orchesella cincta]|uniref:Caspase-1 n=1 Tax=Orchesella cincta TaxID=48709 RepID=A0A1D2MFK7_ORCCI|nr:Caspase-1 [Orchesella cincta]
MERWQEEIIRTNLSYLIKNVKCTTTLLSKLEERNVLSAEDVETVSVNLKQIDKSSTLVRLLKQKLHGFDTLIGVLVDPDVKQYAPAQLLYSKRTSHYALHGCTTPPQLRTLHQTDAPDLSSIFNNEFAAVTPAPTPPVLFQQPTTSQGAVENQEVSTNNLPKELQDFVLNGAKLTVDVKKPNAWDPSKPCSYVLPPKGKGYAFILNITEIRGENIRKGANMDVEYMEKLWKGMGYEIFPKNENFVNSHFKFKEDIQEELKKFNEKCIEDEVDSMVIFIGSHGYNDVIITSDNKTLDLYSDIIWQFQFPILGKSNGKAKRVARIFINQSCQGEPPPGILQNRPFGPPPRTKDSLYIKAQMPKHESSRDTHCGSYFIIVLTYVFMTKAWNTSLSMMLSEVQDLCTRVSLEAGDDAFQLPPSTNLGLAEPLYFFTR